MSLLKGGSNGGVPVLKNKVDLIKNNSECLWIYPGLRESLSYSNYKKYVTYRMKAMLYFNNDLNLDSTTQILSLKIFISETDLPPAVFLGIFRNATRDVSDGKMTTVESYLSFLISTGKYYDLTRKDS